MPIPQNLLLSPRFTADMVLANHLQNNLDRRDDAIRLIGGILERPTSVEFVRNRPDVPNFLVLNSSQYKIVLCGGVQNPGMFGNAASGWSEPEAVARADGFNAYAARLTAEWLRPRMPGRNHDGQSIVLVGHSLGGMLVHALAWQNFKAGELRPDLIVTTGSPRPLAEGFAGFYLDVPTRTFAYQGDPITQMPPRFSEFPSLVMAAAGYETPINIGLVLTGQNDAVLPPSISLWPRFHHAQGLAWLFDDGKTIAVDEAQDSAWTTNARYNNLTLALNAAAGVPEHELSLYSAAIGRWADIDNPLFNKLNPGQEAPEEGLDEPIGDVLPIDNTEQFFMLPLQGFFPMATSPIRTDTQPGPNGGNVGTLFLRGELVAVFPTRSKARTAARYLNRFLARLPIANEVSLSGMTTGMSQYLADAAAARGVDKKPVRLGP